MGRRLDPRVVLLRSISEADWQDRVIQEAELRGWRWWHDNDSRRNKAGLPDLLLWKRDQYLALELKKETGRISDAQRQLMGEWKQAGVECHLWRPSDEGAMQERLFRIGRLYDLCELCQPRA